ncbi:MAG: Crp/Fnr family transcriptional regulator [Burkholderiales bacterium]|nr:Crp/Fnr family transcriptional regulator [Burkholderiales bacterium]MDE2396883.1 Crp/Fnr family transcriptional regulator [Burkholderiales bacterium]
MARPVAAPTDQLIDALPPAVARLAARGSVRRYARGALVIEEGDFGDTLYIILAGRLRAFSSNPDTGREITFGNYGAGEYVGELGLDGGPRSASIEVVEACVCSVIARATLVGYIAEQPDFAFELLAKVIRRARAATVTARQLALNDVYGRVKLLLESLAEPDADGALAVHERLTHRDIANRVGCSREMVSRVFKDLENGAYIANAGRGLRLLRPLPARW